MKYAHVNEGDDGKKAEDEQCDREDNDDLGNCVVRPSCVDERVRVWA